MGGRVARTGSKYLLPVVALLLASLTGCATNRAASSLETVPKVDITRYLGRWYEVARFPASFQEGCRDSTADYALLDDGRVGVVNRCAREGTVSEAAGKAKVVDPATGAKLKVTFFWPFYGDYWIVELGENYEYSVVSEPSRKYLWILSRTPIMEEAVLAGILQRLKAKGFDTSRLVMNHAP